MGKPVGAWYSDAKEERVACVRGARAKKSGPGHHLRVLHSYTRRKTGHGEPGRWVALARQPSQPLSRKPARCRPVRER